MTKCSKLKIAGYLLAMLATVWVGGSSMGQVNQQRNQRHEGFILIQPGLESRCFVSDLDHRECYWVDYGPGINTKAIGEKMTKLDELTLTVWVQVEGTIESEGGFGHNNAYKKRIIITKVIKCSSDPVKKYREEEYGSQKKLEQLAE